MRDTCQSDQLLLSAATNHLSFYSHCELHTAVFEGRSCLAEVLPSNAMSPNRLHSKLRALSPALFVGCMQLRSFTFRLHHTLIPKACFRGSGLIRSTLHPHWCVLSARGHNHRDTELLTLEAATFRECTLKFSFATTTPTSNDSFYCFRTLLGIAIPRVPSHRANH